MPEIDLSEKIPATARWVKVRFQMKPLKPEAQLIARLWSGSLDDAVVIRGETGDAFLKLDKPQKISYQRPVNVELKLRVVAYKDLGADTA